MHKKIWLTGGILVVVLNLLAWLAPYIPFGGNWCDWYCLHILPIWVNIFGRLMNLVRFSVGEIMLVVGIALLFAVLILSFLLIFLRKRKKYINFMKKFYSVFLYVVVAVCLIMTLNCTILYHCSPLDANPQKEERTYQTKELLLLRNFVVEQCNALSEEMERDDQGLIVYGKDMQTEAKQALHGIAGMYPRLKGYYPNVKKIFFSDLMSQAYMAGYYFPFSMEANCNANMYLPNYPEVYCHELAHLHGYIYEDDANFIAFLACVESEDKFFIYSGYLSVLYYVDNAYYESIGKDNRIYQEQPSISGQVQEDNRFLLEETWEKVEETAVFSTAAVDDVSDKFTETSLQLNGVEEGLQSYDNVVRHLLHYYEGILY